MGGLGVGDWAIGGGRTSFSCQTDPSIAQLVVSCRASSVCHVMCYTARVSSRPKKARDKSRVYLGHL